MHEILSKNIVRGIIFSVLAVSLISAIALSVLVHYIPIAKTDVAISREIQANSSGLFSFLMRSASLIAEPTVAAGTIIVVSILLIGIQYQREALFMLFVPIADFAGLIIKNIIQRPRPSEFLVNIYEQSSSFSFPSNHVIHVVVFFGYLFALSFIIKLIPLFLRILIASFSLLMIILISVSRIYLGAHWASDVIGGYLIAFPMLYILLFAYFRVTKPSEL